MMKLKDLKPLQGKVDIEVSIKDKGEERTFNKYGKDLRVCNFTIEDDSGDMTLSLWNNDIDKVKVGDKIKIENGYVSEFNGKKQLTTGKFGKMEVLSGKSAAKADSEEIEEQEI